MGVGMTIELSLGEAEALISKAARGAGLPWGLAAEAGAAARRLIASGEPEAAAAFSDFLSETAEYGASAPCPLRLGLRAADLGTDDPPPVDLKWTLVYEAAASSQRPSPIGRARLHPDIFATLDALARRTYAPATEESRRKGAG